MKLLSPLASVLFLLWPITALTAPPTIGELSATSVPLSSNVTLRATVADPDSDLDYVVFSIAGPGISGWVNLPAVDVNGANAVAQTSWTPVGIGVFTVRAIAYDLSGSVQSDGTFEVFSSSQTLRPFTIPTGAVRLFAGAGEIVTTEATTPTSVVQTGSALIVWAGARIVLKPGFKTEPGVTLFWAAVDHDNDGYSDMEEATDTDGDGMPDAWEIDHGFNIGDAADATADFDGDGVSNVNEYHNGTDPKNKADGLPLPANYQLVLRTSTPGYLGLKMSDWSLTAVPSP